MPRELIFNHVPDRIVTMTAYLKASSEGICQTGPGVEKDRFHPLSKV